MEDAERQNLYLANWIDEQNSAYLYQTLAEIENDPRLRNIYQRLADAERQHAQQWVKRLQDLGVEVPGYHPGWRTRLLAWLAHRFGPNVILPSLMGMESDGVQSYAKEMSDKETAAVERGHGRLLVAIRQSGRSGIEGGTLAQLEGRHRSAGGNALRAAVLGANDGLVSNFSLVMGVAGAALANSTILLTGLAGLLAGAISMALGEWISVQSSRELYEKQIAAEREEIEQSPREEQEELALIYQARGMSEAAAREMSNNVMSNAERGLDTLVREELGIDPDELGGSAWEAALVSFMLFALGAIIPVLPFIFAQGTLAVALSAVFSAGGLFLIGAAITLFTGRSVLSSGLRQMLFGLAAAAVTYLIGRLVGVNLGG